MLTVGLCKMLEYAEKDNPNSMSRQHNKRKHQKGRWKHHPKGVKRPVHVSGWSKRRDKARIDNFWKKYGPPLLVPKKTNQWESLPIWRSMLERDYSGIFSKNCKRFPHYFDAVKDSVGTYDEELFLLQSDTINHHCAHCFTALDDDLFAPKGFYADNGDRPVVFDSGCSVSITPYKDDFVGKITHVKKTITGLSSTVQVEGEGTVLWSFYDDYGVIQHIKVKAYFIPSSPVRLFSPQHYFKQEKSGSFKIDTDGCVFTFASHKTLTFIYSKESHLPIALATKRNDISKATFSGKAYLTAASSGKLNISRAQEELLLWHGILGHHDIADTQRLMVGKGMNDVPLLLPKHAGVSTCNIPLCRSCLRGKGRRTSLESSIGSPTVEHADVIKEGHLLPGDCISTDQYECRVKGRLPNTRGKEDPQKMYCGGTVFVDHASGVIKIHHQVSLGESDTVRSKELHELWAAEHGVSVKSYRGDNGVYKSQLFKEDLEQRHQKMSYSGVGAHGQNGVAERAIQTVVTSARTMMLHQALLWPEHFDMRLWPFALDQAAYLYNHLPNKFSPVAPLEIFTGSKLDSSILRNEKVWGCPAYVLDPKLQDGKKLPKWDPQTRQGQYLGKSSSHASSVGLIRNLRTGYISPQFHVVYDNLFQTVMGGYEDNDAISDQIWSSLVQGSKVNVAEQATAEQEPVPKVHVDWLNPAEQQQRQDEHVGEEVHRRLRMEQEQSNQDRETMLKNWNNLTGSTDSAPLPHESQATEEVVASDSESDKDIDVTSFTPRYRRKDSASKIRRQPGRRTKQPINYKGMFALFSKQAEVSKETTSGIFDSDCSFLSTLDLKGDGFQSTPATRFLKQSTYLSADETYEDIHPLAFVAKVQSHNTDNPTYSDILRCEDEERKLWDAAMIKELKSLRDLGSFKLVPRPRGSNVLQSTWAFKKKRYPDGDLKKYKARFCVRGDQQIEGVDVFETYAPVVSWITVRILLVLSLVLGLSTQQVDYTNAFCQAPLEQTVYVELPKGFEMPNKVLHLQKSVYGLRQSPLNFYKHLRSGLESRGFTKSNHDDCLFTNGEIMVLFWVDDCIFYAKESSSIDAMITSLKDEFLLEREEDMAGFLGLNITRDADKGTITLLQTGLIDKILVATQLDECNLKFTPADKVPLDKDENGDPCREEWDYRSIVGMLLYLAGSTRPDISYAVHQCARFSHQPRASHEVGVKHIVRYLKGTRDKGLIMKPTSDNLKLDLFADADFAGLFASEDKLDPVSVKSRTGILLNFGGVPVCWSSKLQSEIALSTLEAEYIALSQGMRELVSARSLVLELGERMNMNLKSVSQVSKAWEDNVGTQNLANSKGPLMTSRTKHIGIKYHWFRSKIQPNSIDILRIDTKLQRADIFTKGLTRYEFEVKRKLVMGW